LLKYRELKTAMKQINK